MGKHFRTSHTLIRSERAGVTYFQFDALAGFCELFHGVFSRKGGLSKAPFDSLNVAFSVGDNPKDVRENRRLIAKTGPCRYTVYAQQVHGTDILCIYRSRSRGQSGCSFPQR